jgi:thiamine-phosphate pyrophosphorylase
MRAPFDLTLYLVTDPAMTARRGLAATVAAAVEGGVTMVQLRHKDGPARLLAEAGRALHALLAPRGIPLIVNDRVDVAREIGAEGVHVGQGDLSPAAARAMLGPGAIIGCSLNAERQLADFVAGDVDYVGLGPLFPTGTKPDAAPALGEAAFAALRRRLACPVVAIGGITAANAARAIAAGADGVAVVSAICAAPDPRAAARALRAAIDAARRQTAAGTPAAQPAEK